MRQQIRYITPSVGCRDGTARLKRAQHRPWPRCFTQLAFCYSQNTALFKEYL